MPVDCGCSAKDPAERGSTADVDVALVIAAMSASHGEQVENVQHVQVPFSVAGAAIWVVSEEKNGRKSPQTWIIVE